MTNWAYIATPYGAPLYQTLKLARGDIYKRGAVERTPLFRNCGIIFRKLYRSNGDPIEEIKAITPGDTLLLMYNFAHTGVVYPIQQFKVLDPDVAKRKVEFRLEKEPGYKGIGRVALDNFIQINFVPDYLAPEEISGEDVQSVICIERHQEWMPKAAVGKVVIAKKQHELALQKFETLLFVEEKEGKGALEAAYHDYVKDRSFERILFDEHKSFWGHYNGWIKMMLYENKALEASKSRPKAEKAGQIDNRFVNYAFEALPLCAIFEYVLNMLLKKEACSLLLETGKPLMDGTELPVFPESSLESLDSIDRIWVIMELVKQQKMITGFSDPFVLKNLLHNLRKYRNRIAHSYFIEKRHYEAMKLCVHDLLKIFCLNGG